MWFSNHILSVQIWNIYAKIPCFTSRLKKKCRAVTNNRGNVCIPELHSLLQLEVEQTPQRAGFCSVTGALICAAALQINDPGFTQKRQTLCDHAEPFLICRDTCSFFKQKAWLRFHTRRQQHKKCVCVCVSLCKRENDSALLVRECLHNRICSAERSFCWSYDPKTGTETRQGGKRKESFQGGKVVESDSGLEEDLRGVRVKTTP